MKRGFSVQKLLPRLKIGLLLLTLISVLYFFTVLWRVSIEEQTLFGRSFLIQLSSTPRQFIDPALPDSFGDGTYTFSRSGTAIIVYKQLVNSFQHVYGSALTSYELGDKLSDSLFRANEYVEALFGAKAGTQYFYLDTKKDLGNNAVGRKIGLQAREKGFLGFGAEKFMIDETLNAIDRGEVYKHWNDPRVSQLPSLGKYGCPLLGDIQEFRSVDKKMIFK